MADWYAFRTRPGREFEAQHQIDRSGHETVLPVEFKYRRVNRYSKRRELRAYPAMPRYVFAKASPHLEITRTRHVQGVVSLGGSNRPIPPRAAAHILNSSMDAAEYLLAPNPHRSFRKDDLVRLTDGPFEGHVVRVASINRGKACVIVAVFGAHRKIHVPLEILEAA